MTTLARPSVEISSTADVPRSRTLRVALLGLGHVGSAVARLAATLDGVSVPGVDIDGALVRDTSRPRIVPVTGDARTLLDGRPDALVEALGGIEPARTIVLEALRRGIPVVTANKSLLAACGDELIDAAERASVPLRFEACVLAGVPFLGTFDRRPLAAAITRVAGIVNGTTNYILTAVEEGARYEDALRDAQRLGFAEPDASNDVNGIDASEKLAILVRHFGRVSINPRTIPAATIATVTPDDLKSARLFGGTLKPIALADWSSGELLAYAGPAYVPAVDALSSLRGVMNGIRLERQGATPLFFSGAGAGPDATAITLLDDVFEAVQGVGRSHPRSVRRLQPVAAPVHSWFVRFTSRDLPDGPPLCDLLGAYGVWPRSISDRIAEDGRDGRWMLTYPCAAPTIHQALKAVEDGAGCETFCVPALES